MNILKSNKLVIIDFDGSIHDLLKDEYVIVKHTNYMEDYLNFNYPADMIVIDSLFKDGDVFEFIKKTKVKPFLLGEVTELMKKKLKGKVHFCNKEDFFITENYIDIKLDIEGYSLIQKAMNALLEDETLLSDLSSLYGIISKKNYETIERLIRYYKESLIDSEKFISKFTSFNKSYPTNSEFISELLELVKAKKIRVE